MEDKSRVITILKNSEVARRFANVALYIAKISLQTTKTYIDMANKAIVDIYASADQDNLFNVAKAFKDTGNRITHILPANIILEKV